MSEYGSLQFYTINAQVILGTAGQVCVPTPIPGKVVNIKSAISEALTTADEVLTFKNAAGSSMGAITITQSGSAVGDVDELSPTSNNDVVEGGFIEIEMGGENGTAAIANLSIIVRR